MNKKTLQGNWPISTLVDEHSGIIRRVRSVLTPPEAPTSYTSMTAEVSNARLLGEWPADRVSLGTTFSDPDGAWIAAVAEACERYCGNFLPTESSELTIDTAQKMIQDGKKVVDLAKLPRFADWQLKRENFEYQELTPHTETLWTNCHIDEPESAQRGTGCLLYTSPSPRDRG